LYGNGCYSGLAPWHRHLGARGDAGEIALIEQRELKDPGIDQGANLRGAPRSDLVEPGWLDILLDAAWVIMPQSPTSGRLPHPTD
jgi:hypothetical protein